MALEKSFPPDLVNYLLRTTSEEPSLLAQLREETARVTQREVMLSGPIEGKFLQLLVRLMNAKYCVEIGTFTGYATLCIAQGLSAGAKILTLELNDDYANMAQRYFDASGHGDKIQLIRGSATQNIKDLPENIDFIFLDADKSHYPIYYDLLIPKLRSGGLMAVDNALWEGEVLNPQSLRARAIDHLNQKARQDPRVETVMLSIRDGILLVRKCET